MSKNKPDASIALKNDKKDKDKEYFAKIIDEKEKEQAPVAPKIIKNDWLEEDYSGQLAVDVYQDKDNVIIKSTIAGVKPEDLDISINNDMVTIRGTRRKDEEIADEDYFYRECYWGGFSRSIILPQEIKVEGVQANLKNGTLTLIMPKASKTSRVKVIKVKEESE